MKLKAKFIGKIEHIQKHLREANFCVNQMNELILHPGSRELVENVRSTLYSMNKLADGMKAIALRPVLLARVDHFLALLERSKENCMRIQRMDKRDVVAQAAATLSGRLEAAEKKLRRLKPELQNAGGTAAELVPPELSSKATDGTASEKNVPAGAPIEAGQAAEEIPVAEPAKQRFSIPSNKQELERFIGENLLNKIGIGILIIGIGMFVKYAIEQDWVGPLGRVLTGLIIGGGLMALGQRLQKHYRAFSSVLAGGGIAVQYLTIAIAFQEYKMFSYPVAFVIMLLITAAAIGISLRYNRQEIAILAILGGFATPFMLSRGEGPAFALFSYMLILNLGMLVLAWFRNWQGVRQVSYLTTVLLYGGWLVFAWVTDTPIDFGTAMAFCLIYFLVFFAMNMAFNLKTGGRFGAFSLSMMLSNSLFFFAGGCAVLALTGNESSYGLYTFCWGLFHLALVVPFNRLGKAGWNLMLLMTGLGTLFLTLAVPLQLKVGMVPVLWAGEALLVFWLARWTGVRFFQKMPLGLSVLSVIALVNYQLNYFPVAENDLPFLFNPLFLTGLLVVCSQAILFFLQKRDGKEAFSQAMLLLAFLTGFLVGGMEVLNGVGARGSLFVAAGFNTWGLFYFSALFLRVILTRDRNLGEPLTFLSVGTIIAWLYTHFSLIIPLRDAVLPGPSGIANESGYLFKGQESFYPIHFAMSAGVLLLLGLMVTYWVRDGVLKKDSGNLLIWGGGITSLLVLTFELDHILLVQGVYSDTIQKTGYPILWGIAGLAVMWTGMRLRMVQLRLFALALFGVILVKLFAYDIRDISSSGKMIAFISLGVVLLTVSFLYQRLKKLMQKDEYFEADNFEEEYANLHQED